MTINFQMKGADAKLDLADAAHSDRDAGRTESGV